MGVVCYSLIELTLAGSKRHKGDELPRNGPRCLCGNLLRRRRQQSYVALINQFPTKTVVIFVVDKKN